MIEYRKAEMSDIDILSELRVYFLYEGKEVYEKEKSSLLENIRLYFHNAMTNNSFIAWIAFDNGKIIATSGLTVFVLPPNRGCPNGKTAYISNMYTIPEYRCKGIATKLFSLTVDEAKRHGCSKILLSATDMGRPIYQKYGFEESKGWMHFNT
jgi:GNAT superfamily N-acetyltransferase